MLRINEYLSTFQPKYNNRNWTEDNNGVKHKLKYRLDFVYTIIKCTRYLDKNNLFRSVCSYFNEKCLKNQKSLCLQFDVYTG